MTHGRIDKNQSSIVDALRRVGASVQSLADVGGGCPDLLVGLRGRNYLMEVKASNKMLNAKQKEWHQTWHGDVHIVRSPEDALGVLGYVLLSRARVDEEAETQT